MSKIITAADLQSYTGTTIDSGKASLIVDAVNQYIESETHRVWGETKQVTEVSNYQSQTWLKNMDIVSVQSVKVGRGSAQSTASPNSYFFDAAGRLNMVSAVSFSSPYGHLNALAVAYTYGQVAVPDDLKLAALSLAAASVNDATNGEKGVKSTSVGSYSITFDTGSNSQSASIMRAKSVIARYRKPRV